MFTRQDADLPNCWWKACCRVHTTQAHVHQAAAAGQYDARYVDLVLVVITIAVQCTWRTQSIVQLPI